LSIHWDDNGDSIHDHGDWADARLVGSDLFLFEPLRGHGPLDVPLTRPRSRGDTLSLGEGQGEGEVQGKDVACRKSSPSLTLQWAKLRSVALTISTLIHLPCCDCSIRA
jgi:hypothetical protein